MFSVLTSKIFGGVSIALVAALAWVTITKNSEIGDLKEDVKVEREVNSVLRLDNATLRGNSATLELGLAQCSNSVEALRARTESVAKAGLAAVAAAQRARPAADRKLATIDRLPAATCDDALAILKSGGS